MSAESYHYFAVLSALSEGEAKLIASPQPPPRRPHGLDAMVHLSESDPGPLAHKEVLLDCRDALFGLPVEHVVFEVVVLDVAVGVGHAVGLPGAMVATNQRRTTSQSI